MKSRKLALAACILVLTTLAVSGISAFNALTGKLREGVNDSRKEGSGNRIGNESGISYEGPVNILIMGLDEYEGRSDVILLLNYSPEAGKLNMLSVARDTRVYVKGKAVKINALFGIGGERLVTRGVEKITGLPVDYYLTMNFAGFRKIVDALGGVEFDVPFDMDYDDPDQDLHIHLRKGRQILDGRKAEQLVRYRKGNKRGEGYEDGDIGRIKMQQEFLKEMVRQKAKLKYISKIDDIFYIIKDHVRTNAKIGDISRYIGYIKNMRDEDIKTFTLPGEAVFIGDASYFLHDGKKTAELIESCFFK